MTFHSQADLANPDLLNFDLNSLSMEEAFNCFQQVRNQTERLCRPLEIEDYVVQTMPDVSPTKWHLAHTSWFFETFILRKHFSDYDSFHPQFEYLFNSYYNAVGKQFYRPHRGLISRPTVKQVYEYRHCIDEQMEQYAAQCAEEEDDSTAALVLLGLHHEQQHQELMLTDIKHVFWNNPLRPIYRDRLTDKSSPEIPEMDWFDFSEGVHWIGHEGNSFAFDNETPRHRLFLDRFQLSSRLVTNGEFLEFMEDGGYQRPELWLSDGWNVRREEDWTAPLYWEERNNAYRHLTLAGMEPIDPALPVCHVSYYEADAYARWVGNRLPTEAEWEVAARQVEPIGNFVESENFHPVRVDDENQDGPQQMFGDVWEWTQSPYISYPGYKPLDGALGEYNGKFMSNQMVLRGGSCATPQSHIRTTYRNFFPPHSRWQFSGFRLARDVT